MGQIVFQATLGGQTALVGQNTASSFSLTLPLATDTLVGKATTDTLTNKTLTAPVISSIVNTGTLTLPTSTDTLVGRATTDTLTNKTLTSPTLVGPFLGTPASGSLLNCTDYPTSALNGTINLATQVSGTLAVNRGGTGIATLTAGYIPFGAGTSAFNSTSNLFWDNTNTRLGIGTSSPQYALDISSGSTVSSRLIASGSSTDAKSIYTSLGPTGTTVTLYTGTFGSQSAGVITTLTNHPLIFGTYNQTNTMTFDTSGRLGIGTSSPTQPLQLTNNQNASTWMSVVNTNTGSGAAAGVLFTNNSGDYGAISLLSSANSPANALFLRTLSTNPLVFGTSNTEQMRLTSAGYLGIGTSSPVTALNVIGGNNQSGTAYQIGNFANSGATLGTWIGYDSSNGGIIGSNGVDKPIAFWQYSSGAANYVERMRLDSSGNLLVGTTSNYTGTDNGFILGVGSGTALTTKHASGTASGTYYSLFVYNGSIIGSITQSGTAAVLYNVTSDQRLKENIVDAPSGNIDQIKVRSFDWIADNSHQTYGMVAQELVEVAPYAVHQPTNPEEMMAVDYSKLVPMMIREIQDLKAEVNQLKAKVGI
jgi:Chaperone of endosialidase